VLSVKGLTVGGIVVVVVMVAVAVAVVEVMWGGTVIVEREVKGHRWWQPWDQTNVEPCPAPPQYWCHR
jgi:hypothetical protein